jgi:hypothetical protein
VAAPKGCPGQCHEVKMTITVDIHGIRVRRNGPWRRASRGALRRAAKMGFRVRSRQAPYWSGSVSGVGRAAVRAVGVASVAGGRVSAGW